jgi:hypothetical protein
MNPPELGFVVCGRGGLVGKVLNRENAVFWAAAVGPTSRRVVALAVVE